MILNKIFLKRFAKHNFDLLRGGQNFLNQSFLNLNFKNNFYFSVENTAENSNANATPKAEEKTKPSKSKEIPPPSFENFAQLDIRVGKITECWKVKIRYIHSEYSILSLTSSI